MWRWRTRWHILCEIIPEQGDTLHPKLPGTLLRASNVTAGESLSVRSFQRRHTNISAFENSSLTFGPINGGALYHHHLCPPGQDFTFFKLKITLPAWDIEPARFEITANWNEHLSYPPKVCSTLTGTLRDGVPQALTALFYFRNVDHTSENLKLCL